MKKKVIAFLLALCMVSGTVLSPISTTEVNAEETEEYADDFQYTVLEDGTIEITGLVESEDITELIIPSEIEGKEVTSIGDRAFANHERLISVEMPNSITKISDYAFEQCSNLEKVVLSNAVTSIGGRAFQDCTSLENITIPKSVTAIGTKAFEGTKWLDAKRADNPLVIVNNIVIDGKMVQGDVSIPDTVKSICALAFRENSGLTSIEIPSGITCLDVSVFHTCNNLTSIKIPSSVTKINSWAFWLCDNLKDVYYTGTQEQWKEIDIEEYNDKLINATIHCNSSTPQLPDNGDAENADKVIAPEQPETDNGNVGNNNMEPEAQPQPNVDFLCAQRPDGTVLIGGCTGTEGLTEISIPSMLGGGKVTGIMGNVFNGCSSLINIEIPSSVTYIGNSAFLGCSNLTSIEIPSGVEYIYESTFEGCSNLVSIKIPDSATSIGARTFSGCSSLTNIEIPSSVAYIGNSAFAGTPWLKSKQQENPLVVINGILIDGTAVSGNVELPAEITSIASEAFGGCSNLTSIEIPSSVGYIYEATFEGCSNLVSIKIPDSVTSIGARAFSGCDALKDIYYSGSETQWKKIIVSDKNDEIRNATIHFDSFTQEIPDNGNNDNVSNSETPVNNNIPSNTVTALNTLTVAQFAVTYTGKTQTPAITVTDANGKIVEATNYTVTYADNQKVGQATVTVTGKGNYSGTLTANFNILPKGTSISKVTAKKQAFIAKWEKQTKEVTGYQIQYSASKKFKGAKTTNVKKNKTTSATVKKLKANKKYYVRIRTYKTVKINGKSQNLYSEWSKAKNVKI